MAKKNISEMEKMVSRMLANARMGEYHTGIFVRNSLSFATDGPVMWIETEYGFFEIDGPYIHEITEEKFRVKTENAQELKV